MKEKANDAASVVVEITDLLINDVRLLKENVAKAKRLLNLDETRQLQVAAKVLIESADWREKVLGERAKKMSAEQIKAALKEALEDDE